MAYESDYTTTYDNRPLDVQFQEDVNHIYPYEHIIQYSASGHDHNHVNQGSSQDNSAGFYQQTTLVAASEYNPEIYMHEQPERFKEFLHPQLISTPFLSTPFHNRLGELEEGMFRLATAILCFQPITSVPRIGLSGQLEDELATHLEHMLHTTNLNGIFPSYLINDTTQFVRVLLHKIHANNIGTIIPSPLVPVTPESSFRVGNCAFTSTSPSTPSSPAYQSRIRDVGKEFENFPSIARVPPHIQCRFMPQQVYSSRAKADHDRYVKDADLKLPIIFRQKYHDYVGILLRDVLDAGLGDILMDANEVVLDHGPPSTYIRLRVPGYAPDGKQKHQISLKTHERSRNSLTKARLLRSVANAIRKILENLANEQQDHQHVADLPFRWTIGKEAGQIGIHNLYIASLHNVSQGTWQPHLYLDPSYSLFDRAY